ncbi:MAG: AgmX/PglI C-terminal domain-containing protein [Myxococcales bacterium]|nr:AgmX/PglI C-terminal domain-containing protein [Myxococcales bacterium]
MTAPLHNHDHAGRDAKLALRLGLFLAGKPLEERLFRHPREISIGKSAACTVIVPPTEGLGESTQLFVVGEKGWVLQFGEEWKGRLSIGGQPVSLQQLIDDGDAVAHKQRWQVPLGAAAKGELRFGDLKLLFQLVPPPPLAPRPQLPSSLRPQLLTTLDMRLAQIALASFVAHFAFVVYLRAMERPKPTAIEEIPERFVKMLVPKKVEPPKLPPQPKADAKKPDDKKPDDKKKTDTAQNDKPAAPKKEEDPAEIAARAAAQRAKMEQQLQTMGVLKMLTAKGPDGALADALKDGSGDGDPDKVFREVGGVGPVTGQAGMGTVRGGDGTGTSQSIGSLTMSGPRDGVGTGEKTEKKVRAVVQDSAPQDLDPGDLDPGQVAAKIRQYRGAMVACYEAALKRNPTLAGKITLRFSVNQAGKVSHVEIEVDTMHDDDFAKCIVDRAQSWRFPAPKGGGEVQFAYPFIFQSSK